VKANLSALRRFVLIAAALAVLRLPPAAAASQPAVAVAAASNLVYALAALDAEFVRANPNVKVTSMTGASGSLVAQIRNGAPYDVFLSADLDFAQKLIQGGGAPASSLRTFAFGRLVLWTTKPGLDLGSLAALVRNPAVQKLAIANPESAPYGLAAMQVLEKLHLQAAAQSKLVRGENISQTAEFVETGNADAGLVALSLVLSPKLKDRGHWQEVPAEWYAPLGQAAVLTARGAANPTAQAYLDFLGSPAAGKILEQFGYRLP
jgi:molybdate transport system substrate-binding protein